MRHTRPFCVILSVTRMCELMYRMLDWRVYVCYRVYWKWMIWQNLVWCDILYSRQILLRTTVLNGQKYQHRKRQPFFAHNLHSSINTHTHARSQNCGESSLFFKKQTEHPNDYLKWRVWGWLEHVWPPPISILQFFFLWSPQQQQIFLLLCEHLLIFCH